MTNDSGAVLGDLRVRNMDAVVERLDDPQTAAALLDLLDNVATLNGALQMLGGFLEHGEHIMENVRGAVIDLKDKTKDTPAVQATPQLFALAAQAVPAAATIADSGVVPKLVDPQLLALLGTLAECVHTAREEVRREPSVSYGPLKLMSALKDPDVSRGIDFGLRVLKGLGASLATDGK